ncbi:IS3 family transposase [Streptococcus castoreus]|uniref:IS3 family transposase n=1 Tax=Streptococcus castoreus TaxID=254786 RepID=UPI000A03A9B8|nr:IS3 family transposase [Streptococcus castoreus]
MSNASSINESLRLFFYEHKERYGSVRITQELYRQEITVNRKCLGRLLHELCLYTKGSRYKYKYYNCRRPVLTRPNLSHQYFQAKTKNETWLSNGESEFKISW